MPPFVGDTVADIIVKVVEEMYNKEQRKLIGRCGKTNAKRKVIFINFVQSLIVKERNKG